MLQLWRRFRCLTLGHRWEYEAIVVRGWQDRVCCRCFADGRVKAQGNHLDHWRS